MILLIEKSTSSDKNSIRQINEGDNMNLVSLMHPKGVPVVYMIYKDDVYEVQTIQPMKYCSWFINQRVSNNECIYVANKIDLRYLILSDMIAAGSKYSPLDQIIITQPTCCRIPIHMIKRMNMTDVCDINDKYGEDMILYRYNEDKTMKWLTDKVNRTCRVIAKQRIRKNASINTSFVSNFNVSEQSTITTAATTAITTGKDSNNGNGESESVLVDNADDDIVITREDTKVALQIICDYLTETIASKLVACFDMTLQDLLPSKAAQNITKRKADWEIELEIEKETLAFQMPPASGASSSSNINSKGSSSASKVTATAAGTKKKAFMPKEIKQIAGVQKLSNFFTSNKK